jgi:hypothetical protein
VRAYLFVRRGNEPIGGVSFEASCNDGLLKSVAGFGQLEVGCLTFPYPDLDLSRETDLIVINEYRYIMV